jgi:hypothetical protein
MVVASAALCVKKRSFSDAMIRRVFMLYLFFGLLAGACNLRSVDMPVGVDRLLPGRARIITVRDPQSVEAFTPQLEKIRPMFDTGLTHLTGKNTPTEAWRTLISSQDVIGIKVYAQPGPMSGTRPAVAAAIVQSLIASGHPPKQILIWDKHIADLRASGFFELAERYGVRVAGAAEEGYDDKIFYETALIGKLVWGDHEFGKLGIGVGRKSFVSKLVTQKMTRIINLTPLLNHNLAGVSGNLYGLTFGSIDNILRFENSREHLHSAIPEIYALPELGDRVVLNVVDALICQYQGEERTFLHYATSLSELRFSKDPVALDVLSIDELNRQRQNAKVSGLIKDFQIYTNASLLEIGISDLSKVDVDIVP